MPAAPSYEMLRDQLEALDVPEGEARELIWIVPGRLGAAVTAVGAFEIFLLGPPLEPRSATVAASLQHDRWNPSDGGAVFEASRVLLGSDTHFAAVAALIATELGRLDLSKDAALQRAFNEVEPIIELAIRRAALSSETILGLLAELQVLRALLLASSRDERSARLPAWRGWAPGRDFAIGPHGVEVKATLGVASRHQFSGVHQLEPQPLPDGRPEKLHLLSVGLEQVEHGGQSLPELVDDLLSMLSDGSGEHTPVQAQLLAMIASYGGPGAPSYEHDAMRAWSVYQQRYALTFTRLYEVDDPAMRLLDRGLVEQTFATPESLTFELVLPSIVSPYNPTENWQAEIAAMIAD